MFRKSFVLENSSGEFIHGDVRYREDTREAPAIMILHGFKGFKDWGFFPDVAMRLAESGYVAVSFNFSRNGIGADPKKFTELDKFAENTISQEAEDARLVLQAIRTGEIARKAADAERIGVLGHSRGGGIALLIAAENPDTVQCVATWSTVASFNRFTDEQKQLWQTQGFVEIENVRTKQMMRINRTFLDDLLANQSRFDLEQAAEKIQAPTLCIHGGADQSVPPEESERIYARCGALSKRLEIIEETDHTFGIKHPMETVTVAYETVADLTETWFDSHLMI